MRLIIIISILLTSIMASKYDKVKITENISQLLVFHKGKTVSIHRIQDTKHHLTGAYAKISQLCPSRCIQPISMGDDVETIGEVEVIDFIKNKVNAHKGALIDARPKNIYNKETIPSAINIPFSLVNDIDALISIMEVLGMKKISEGIWDESQALDIVVYCNGAWCGKSKTLIKSLLKVGYPAEKIHYYRGGFQMWKSLGLTTIKTK